MRPGDVGSVHCIRSVDVGHVPCKRPTDSGRVTCKQPADGGVLYMQTADVQTSHIHYGHVCGLGDGSVSQCLPTTALNLCLGNCFLWAGSPPATWCTVLCVVWCPQQGHIVTHVTHVQSKRCLGLRVICPLATVLPMTPTIQSGSELCCLSGDSLTT